MQKKALIFICSLILFIFTRCGIIEPEKPSGSLHIILQSECAEKTYKGQDESIIAVQCILKRGRETVYDRYLSKALNTFRGEIRGLIPDTNYSVLILGKPGQGNNAVIARGFKSGIKVLISEDTRVELTWKSFKPVLESPEKDYVVTTNKPVFIWYNNPGAIQYFIKMDNSDLFENPDIYEYEIFDTTYTPSNSFPNGSYYWKIGCVDTMGNCSNWSETWRFVIDVKGMFPTPLLITPEEDFTLFSTSYPDFQWEEVPGAESYLLQVDNDSFFTSLVINQKVINQTCYTHRNALQDGTYKWRVVAKNYQGDYSDWSDVWTFNIDLDERDAPFLISPSDSSIFSDSYPEFVWSDIDDAVVYHLIVCMDEQFTTPVINEQNLVQSNYKTTDPLAIGTYFWKVKYVNNMELWSDWSAIWNFNVEMIQ